MYKYLNAHPDGKSVGDCAKRAIATAEGRDYREVSLMLNRLKKESGADKFNSGKNLKYYFKKMGYLKHAYQAVAGQKRMTPEQFSKEHPKGAYILWMAGHVSCCVDGIVFDTWDCTGKCVYTAWTVRCPFTGKYYGR